jgi:hypothetical protein
VRRAAIEARFIGDVRVGVAREICG